MTSLFDNVQGCVLYIQELHSKIAFTTPSDALLTSFFIKYSRKVPLELFDDLFSIFQHADFHADRITMKISEDIMDHIAEQRRANQVYNQELVKSPEVDQPIISRPPGLVVELVADYLENNRVPFHRTFQFGRFSHLICESTATLRLMSLVHRSWKEAAQRRLRRRIRINSLFELRGVFQNPQLGPWVRELDFRAHDFEVHPTEEIPGSIDEMPRLLSGILRRCPNVTHLHLDNFIRPVKERMNTQDEEGGTELNSEHDFSRPVVIRQLGEMKYLEHLWLQSTVDLAPNLWNLCAVLPRLQSLKSLSLDNWESRLPSRNAGQSVEPSGFKIDTNPPPSLKYLSFGSISVIDPEPFTWIISPRNGYNCIYLQLSLANVLRSFSTITPWLNSPPSNVMDLRHIVRRIKPTVMMLRLVQYQPEDDISSVMELFPSLQSLSLSGYSTLPDHLALPSSIYSFHFHYTKQNTIYEREDARCLALIKASPSIRKIHISYAVRVVRRGPDTILPSAIFIDSMDYCLSNNIEFSVIKIDSDPYFLDFV